jgi:type VI secretion system secreted protein VgrG
MSATQQTAPLAVETTLGQDVFQLLSVDWSESLGMPFVGRLEMLSTDSKVDLRKLLKTDAAVRIDRPDGSSVWLHGSISRMESLGGNMRMARYRATIVPCIALLKNSGGCRIFQDFTVIDIVKKIFSDFGFSGQLESRVTGQYAKRDYCVQYGESDFNFISRILQSEGIYYYFEYSKEKHCVVLADDIQAHHQADGNETIDYRPLGLTRQEEYLAELACEETFGTGGVELGDYDFEKPRSALLSKQLGDSGDSRWLWYDYPGDFLESDRGLQLAKIRQQAIDASNSSCRLRGSARSVRAGNVFTLKDHEQTANNIEYLVTGTTIKATLGGLVSNESDEFNYAIEVIAQPSKLPFRPEFTAAKTRISGPHVATVVGKQGEEIWTDEYGRIKVQFPWDRVGKSDEHSSCWIRVAQPWTGKNWGAISLPRIGEEVIVHFLNGDPDRPIVVGRVYNADMMPPEALAAAQAKTVFRTRSTKGGDKNCFHELTFDDTKDQESIYLHSERDFKRVVENNDETTIGFEKKDPGDHKLSIYNNSQVTIGEGSQQGSLTVDIYKDRTVTLETGNDSLTVAKGNLEATVDKGNVTIKVSSGSTTIDSAKSIQLTCGQSSITIKPSEIVLSSATIKLSASGTLDMQGGNATLAASGNLELKGAMGKLASSGPLTLQGAIVKIN